MIPLGRPASLGDLLVLHGGELDPELDPRELLSTIAASDREEDCDLAPVLSDRGATMLRARPKVWLVSAESAARVPAGRRWVHPHAEAVLVDLLESTLALPATVVPPDARVEANVVLFPNVTLGRGVVLGAGSVIGRPGFRYVGGRRVPHRAGVVLGDGVEVGASCTIDAGILAPTTLGAHTKLDAQVHVGHGVRVGSRCMIAAQVGLAGSVVLEDDVWIGGQAGVADHCHVGRGARIAAKAGVIGDVPAGETYAGYPAVARGRWLRGHARLYRR